MRCAAVWGVGAVACATMVEGMRGEKGEEDHVVVLKGHGAPNTLGVLPHVGQGMGLPADDEDRGRQGG